MRRVGYLRVCSREKVAPGKSADRDDVRGAATGTFAAHEVVLPVFLEANATT